jgi:hypothetical protein
MGDDAGVISEQRFGERLTQIQRGLTVKRESHDGSVCEIKAEADAITHGIEFCGRHAPACIDVA